MAKVGASVYVIPNLFTTANLFFGFFSIIKSLGGHYQAAAFGLLLAALFDAIDGRIARMTGGTSEFGVQYDSLCDLVSFGLAPAFLVYQMGLRELGRFGWILCFLYLVSGALRLARFNVQSAIGRADGNFTGLPIPMAAFWIAAYVLCAVEFALPPQEHLAELHDFIGALGLMTKSKVYLGFFLPLLAVLMVSNISYRSHKTLHFKDVKPFQLLAILILSGSFFIYEAELSALFAATLYVLSGPIEWRIGWSKLTDEGEIFAKHPSGSTAMEEP